MGSRQALYFFFSFLPFGTEATFVYSAYRPQKSLK